jgi:hypothetical protein
MESPSRSEKPFIVKPKHWWDYLNPRWYAKKRVMESFLKYQWEQGGLGEKVADRIKRHFLYGEKL